jgi:hypothetical protein
MCITPLAKQHHHRWRVIIEHQSTKHMSTGTFDYWTILAEIKITYQSAAVYHTGRSLAEVIETGKPRLGRISKKKRYGVGSWCWKVCSLMRKAKILQKWWTASTRKSKEINRRHLAKDVKLKPITIVPPWWTLPPYGNTYNYIEIIVLVTCIVLLFISQIGEPPLRLASSFHYHYCLHLCVCGWWAWPQPAKYGCHRFLYYYR